MTAIEAQPTVPPQVAGANPAQPYPSGRWTVRNPFHRRTVGEKDPGPVQGELSLDAIRPVRNDLSDSDLEIVPAKRPAAKPVNAPAPAPVVENRDAFSPAASPLWSRLRARLLKRV